MSNFIETVLGIRFSATGSVAVAATESTEEQTNKILHDHVGDFDGDWFYGADDKLYSRANFAQTAENTQILVDAGMAEETAKTLLKSAGVILVFETTDPESDSRVFIYTSVTELDADWTKVETEAGGRVETTETTDDSDEEAEDDTKYELLDDEALDELVEELIEDPELEADDVIGDTESGNPYFAVHLRDGQLFEQLIANGQEENVGDYAGIVIKYTPGSNDEIGVEITWCPTDAEIKTASTQE